MEFVKLAGNYIKFYFVAHGKKGFGIHSPFAFNLVTQVIGKDKKQVCFGEIEDKRNALLKNHNIIGVTDYGSGSTFAKNAKRDIADIARHSLKPSRQTRLLYRLVSHFQSQNIIEMGTSLGITTCYLAKANSNAQVFTLEGCPEISKIACNTFEDLKISNIQLVTGEFNQTLPTVLDSMETVDLVFFDGNHQDEATIGYFTQCLQKKHNNSLFIFDDIHRSPGMELAWDYIKTHPEVAVTFDLFFMGLVFFKKELTKQHFTIRF